MALLRLKNIEIVQIDMYIKHFFAKFGAVKVSGITLMYVRSENS